MKTLTTTNASKAKTIININHPEWGTKKFNFDSSVDKFHTFGTGSNSSLLFEHEFKFWNVVNFK